jgi:uncharacterized membrane protein YsdA (DUF1294 family)
MQGGKNIILHRRANGGNQSIRNDQQHRRQPENPHKRVAVIQIPGNKCPDHHCDTAQRDSHHCLRPPDSQRLFNRHQKQAVCVEYNPPCERQIHKRSRHDRPAIVFSKKSPHPQYPPLLYNNSVTFSRVRKEFCMPYLIIFYNLWVLFLFGIDKYRSKKQKRRIPERILLLSAAAFGAPGAYLAMLLFRHKTKKPKFFLLIPLLAAAQIALLFYLRHKGFIP